MSSTSSAINNDEFAKVASQYSLYRPLYPNELFTSLLDEIKLSSNITNNLDQKIIVDIGIFYIDLYCYIRLWIRTIHI